MAINYPTSLDNFTNPQPSDTLDSVATPHATQHSDLNDAVEALQAKVGADSSAVTTSHDYKIAQIESDISTAQSDISTAQSDISTAQSDITALEGRATTLEASYQVRRVVVETDTSDYSTTTSWALGPTFTNITGFNPNSKVLLSYHIPMRNDSTSWGGGYIEPQITFNNSTWQSLGSSGYDGGVMNNSSASIGSYFQQILIDPGISTAFSVRVRFYFRSYDNTVRINQSHDLNNISGTATLMSGVNATQHYAKIIVQELGEI